MDKLTEVLFMVSAKDLHPIGVVEDNVYLRWVQEISETHWERFSPQSALNSTLWIAVRHCVSYLAMARVGDSIIARTNLKRLKGSRAVFTTVFLRGSAKIVEAESTWVCLDSQTKAPKTLEDDILIAFSSTVLAH